MLNQDEFIKRLYQVFEYYNLSAATFAEAIKVQRSSISHILSGRNKPSLEFILKMINTYDTLTLDWLLNGEGKFPKEKEEEISKENKQETVRDSPPPLDLFMNNSVDHEPNSTSSSFEATIAMNEKKTTPSDIERIVVFYNDGTFKDYLKR